MNPLLLAEEIDFRGDRPPRGNVIAAWPRPGSAIPERDLPESESLPALLARLANAPAREMIFEDILAVGEIGLWHGQPRVLKTWAAGAAAIACASGTPLFGRFAVPKARPVLLIQNEDHPQEIGTRLLDLSRGAGLDEPPANIYLFIRQGFLLEDPEWQAWVIREVRRLNIGPTIFDSFRSVSDLTDQGPHELRPVAVFLRRLIDITGCAVLLIHHDTKPQADGRPETRRRAQRASGGAVFSISESPVHVERIDETHSLFCPDGTKYRPDAEAVTLTLERGNGYARLTAEATTGQAPEDVALHQRILGHLEGSPGSYGAAIARGIRANKAATLAALETLDRLNRVDSVREQRGTRWFLKRNEAVS